MIKRVKLIVVGAFVLAGIMVLGQQAAQAAITGTVCNSCHTMHNSQGGSAMTSSTDVGTAAQDYLLMFSCLGCHTQESDGDSALTAANAPAVHHTGGDPTNGNYLAGGSFYYVWNQGSFGDAYGHNVLGLGNDVDGSLSDAPGDTEFTAFSGQLDCTGASGCHVGGAHHNNSGNSGEDGATTVVWVDGSSAGASYRFLSGGVQGGEMGNWEYASTGPQAHNVYYSSGTYSSAGAGTITAFCATCHGDFHGKADLAAGGIGGVEGSGTAGQSPWVRHPTDIGLLDAAVHAEHGTYGSYSVTVPIGTATAGTNDVALTMTTYNTVVDTDLEFVVCQSCHRAHGSQYLDMLRWSYSDMVAGTTGSAAGTGCFKCHSQKDGN
jgi:hypothetical protein